MLRERQYILRQVNVGLDLLLTAAAFFIAHLLRELISRFIAPDAVPPAHITNYLWLLAAAPLAVVLAMAANGIYDWLRTRLPLRRTARRMGIACVEAAALLVVLDFAFGRRLTGEAAAGTSRAMIVLLPTVAWVLLVAKSWALRAMLRRRRAAGHDVRRVVLVGSGPPLAQFAGQIAHHPIWGLAIEGIVTDRPEFQGARFDAAAVPESALGHPILADLAGAPEALWRRPIDEVILLPDAAPLGALRPLMEICEEMGVRTHLPLNFFKGRIARPLIDHFEDTPVLSYWPTRDIGPALLFKYAFDRVAAAASLIVLAPLFAAIALAIRHAEPGQPVLFRQTRCGLNGRLFTLYKFRTMRVGAEADLAGLAALNEQEGPVFKIRHDPRITRPGRWLRRSSLDELPQIWNVLRGEMSLVGPRPPLPAEIELYDRWQRRRLSMKPGITCIWQVSGRNMLPFETWMKLDLQYIDNWSLMLDFKILARTVYAVLTGYGAM